MKDPAVRLEEILEEMDNLDANREVLREEVRKRHEELNVISYTLSRLRRELIEIQL